MTQKNELLKAYEQDHVAVIIDGLALDVNAWAQAKGFWRTPDEWQEEQKFIGLAIKSMKIALVHSELSELLEALRKPTDSGIPGFTNEEEEVADAIIRLLDYAGQYRLRIGAAIRAKMAKNEGRPYMHGKSF